jgi:hypothetical protein
MAWRTSQLRDDGPDGLHTQVRFVLTWCDLEGRRVLAEAHAR